MEVACSSKEKDDDTPASQRVGPLAGVDKNYWKDARHGTRQAWASQPQRNRSTMRASDRPRNKESDPPMDKQHPQQQWQQAVSSYAQAINRFVSQGQAQGWDDLQEPQAPPTEHLLPAWQAALQAINQPGVSDAQRQAFREAWPPAHQPLLPLLEQHGQAIGTLLLLDDGSLLARIGTPFDRGQVVRIDGYSVTPVIGVEHFGRCPQRRYFALANAEGIRVTDGWGGPQVARFAWPNGLEGCLPATRSSRSTCRQRRPRSRRSPMANGCCWSAAKACSCWPPLAPPGYCPMSKRSCKTWLKAST